MRFILLAMFALIVSVATAQQGSIKGTLFQKDNSTPFAGVIVYLDGTNLSSISNAAGDFEFNNLNSGEYQIYIANPGYKKVRISVQVNPTVSNKLEIILEENVTDLPAVLVSHVTLTGGSSGIKNLPGSAYYLSPKELQKFAHTDVNRVLRGIPGVNLQEEDGYGLRPNIGMRGSGVERSNKITIMEDGVLMAPAPYAAPAAYYFPTIGRMQAVEVLKGSSQIKYGPYTTGGAINFISTQIPKEFSGRVGLSGGSFGGRNINLFVGNSHERIGYSIESFNYSSDGFKKIDGGGKTGFNKQDIVAKLRFNTKKTAKVYQSLSFKFGQATETSHETYLGLTLDDFKQNAYRRYAGSQVDLMETKQTQISATHLIQPTKFMSVTTTVYRTEFSRNWYKLDAVSDSTGTKHSISKVLSSPENVLDAYAVVAGQTSKNANALYVKGNNRNYSSTGVQTVIGLDFKTGAISHDIDLGFRYHQDDMDRFQYEDQYRMTNGRMLKTKAGEAGRESNRYAIAIAAASYIQYTLKYKNWTLVPGLRHENIFIKELDFGKNDPTRTGSQVVTKDNQTSTFIPGVSLDYSINKHWYTFAGVHKGFAPAGTTAGSNPEESINYELGFKHFSKGFNAQFVAFYNDYKNLLGADLAAGGGTGSGDLFNGGKARSQGMELLVQYDVLSKFKTKFNLPITVSYTYTDAFFKSTFNSTFEDWGSVESGDKLPYLAQHQIAINGSLEHARYGLNISSKYNSEMRGVAGSGTIAEGDLIPSYFILDLSVYYNIQRNVSLTASVNNVLNETYLVAVRPAGLRPGLPRVFQLGLRATF